MAPPLDRKDLYAKDWKPRPSYFRLPRRTRRATYVCWALVIAALYLVINSATQWSNSGGYFAAEEPLITIQFPNLYSSLARVVETGSSGFWNRNVIFVAGNLTAASKLAGVACEMAEYQRTNVHMALMGFDDLGMDDFRRFNGLPADYEEGGCRVYLHDARPASANRLSLERKKIAVKSAFRQIYAFMRPRAMLIDPTNEEKWFMDLAKEKARQMKTSLIELPKNSTDNLRWVTRLDSGSLNAWHKPSFEIVIHADAHSGNLERLLKTLQTAYYPSLEHRPKRVTIVLDPFVPVHPLTKGFLQDFKFPEEFKVTIQRPLIPKDDAHAAALNFVESFYTLSDDHSVLFLDPNTELSKWYCHYLLFTTLEYRYSVYQGPDARTLFGISLEPPASYLSGDAPFPISDFKSSLFLYPAPTSRAALFFPQHWSEFHSYISHKLIPHPRLGARNASHTAPDLTLSKDLATSWKSPFIELARARGYTMLYPSFEETLAIVHNEVPSSHTMRKTSVPEKRIMEKGFMHVLPNGDLPMWSHTPLLDFWGKRLDSAVFETAAMNYRLSISTCHEITYGKEFEVDDLFCDEDGNSV